MDRTAEDIKQDERIAKLEKKIGWVDTHETRIRDLEAQSAGLAKELADAKKALSELEPLKKLAGFADHIHKALGLPQ